MKHPNALKALLVDPSLFTAPYDAELTHGLVAAGVEPIWATRPLRPGERQMIPSERVRSFFYRRSDGLTTLPPVFRAMAKGFSHVAGLGRLFVEVSRERPEIVHFQWTVIPALDALAMLILRISKPVIMTVHDTTAYNGEKISFLQNAGFNLPIRLSSHIIVHTASAKQALIDRKVSPKKISIVPHGPLRLHAEPMKKSSTGRSDMRWTFVLFGQIKPYKGVDTLVEAVAMIPPCVRCHARFIVAGAPMMDMTPIQGQLDRLGLRDIVDLRLGRLTEEEMATLFDEADTFLFPYRQIDASGVYFLVKQFSKWTIASRVGIFAEELADGLLGALVAPGEVEELANAIQSAIRNRPTLTRFGNNDGWEQIGVLTRAVYERTIRSCSHNELLS